MTTLDPIQSEGFFAGDIWSWWQARRLRYNVALAVSGVLAYGLAVMIASAFHQPLWPDWRTAVSMTLGLGVAFLVTMGAANVAYLLGPSVEAWLRPTDVARFRRAAFAMGFWGSAALPFSFPLLVFAGLLGDAAA